MSTFATFERELHIRYRLELDSELHVGGEGDGYEDLLVELDGEGLPYVPGSALKGALRAYAASILPVVLGEGWGKALLVNVFGGERDGDANAARLWVGHACWDGKSPLPPLHSRGRTAVDPGRGTAEEKARFDIQSVRPNTLLSGELFVRNPDDETLAVLGLLFDGLERGELRLGRGSAAGYGELRLAIAGLADVASIEDEFVWLMGDKQDDIPTFLNQCETCWNELTSRSTAGPHNAPLFVREEPLRYRFNQLKLSMSLTPTSPFLVAREGDRQDYEADLTPELVPTPWGPRYGLYGSSLRGPLRARWRYWCNALNLPGGADLFSHPLYSVFGDGGELASRLYVSSAIPAHLDDATPPARPPSVRRPRVALDALNQHVIGGPFTISAATKRDIEGGKLSASLTLRNFELWHLGLLGLVLRDIGLASAAGSPAGVHWVRFGHNQTNGFGGFALEFTGLEITNWRLPSDTILIGADNQKAYGLPIKLDRQNVQLSFGAARVGVSANQIERFFAWILKHWQDWHERWSQDSRKEVQL